MMKGWIFLVVSVVALAAGGTLSFSGYQASSSTITVTRTQSFMTAMTTTNSSVSISSATTQTTNENDVYDHTYSIDAPGSNYCGYYDDSAYTTLDQGTVRISFSAGNDPVDFWMLTPDQHKAWVAITTCDGDRAYTGTASRMGVTHWDTTVDVPSTGVYYFLFMNSNSHTVSVSLTVSALSITQTTEMLAATSYLTASSTWPTQTLAANQQAAGLGLLFFLGTALLVIGVVVLGFFYVRSRGERVDSGTTNTRMYEDTAASAAIIAAPSSETKADTEASASVAYCSECGAEIPKDSRFCKKCGTKVE